MSASVEIKAAEEPDDESTGQLETSTSTEPVEVKAAEKPGDESTGPLETSTSTEPVEESAPDRRLLLGAVAVAVTVVVLWRVQ